MADDLDIQQPVTKKSLGGKKIVITLVVSVVLALVLAGVVYVFVVQGFLLADEKEQPAIPARAVWHVFPQASATLRMPPDSAGLGASLVMYEISFLCSNPEAQSLVSANAPFFQSMLNDLHSNRYRTTIESEDVRKSIEQEARIRGNEFLHSLPGVDPARHFIIMVKNNYFIFDP